MVLNPVHVWDLYPQDPASEFNAALNEGDKKAAKIHVISLPNDKPSQVNPRLTRSGSGLLKLLYYLNQVISPAKGALQAANMFDASNFAIDGVPKIFRFNTLV